MDQLSGVVKEFVNKVADDSCEFLFETEQHPLSGGECYIFALAGRHSRYAVRVEQRLSESTLIKVRREIELLEATRKAHIEHLPALVGYDLYTTPPLIATIWAEGHTLTWSDDHPPAHIRSGILRSLAEVSLDMLRVQEHGVAAHSWILNKINRTRVARAWRGELPGISVEDCEALKTQIAKYHIPSLDAAPHVLVHGDMSLANIVVKNRELQCVLDLGTATLVPLQFAPSYPRFLTNEPCGTDWSKCAYTEFQKQDRLTYLQYITELAPRRGDDAEAYAQILGREDEEDRHWWLSAIGRRDIMVALKSRAPS